MALVNLQGHTRLKFKVGDRFKEFRSWSFSRENLDKTLEAMRHQRDLSLQALLNLWVNRAARNVKKGGVVHRHHGSSPVLEWAEFALRSCGGPAGSLLDGIGAPTMRSQIVDNGGLRKFNLHSEQMRFPVQSFNKPAIVLVMGQLRDQRDMLDDVLLNLWVTFCHKVDGDLLKYLAGMSPDLKFAERVLRARSLLDTNGLPNVPYEVVQ